MGGNGRGVAARLGVAAVLTVALGGCWWPQTGAGPDRRAHNSAETAITAESVSGLHELWSAPTDGPAGNPVTSLAGVHVDGTDHAYGFRTDGTPRWSVPVPDGLADVVDFTSMLVDGDRVLAVHEGGVDTQFVFEANAAIWLDTATGALLGSGTMADGVRDGVAAGSQSFYGDGVHVETLQVADLETGALVGGGNLSLGFIPEPPRAPTHVTLGATAAFQSGPGLPANSQGIANMGVRAFPTSGGARTCGPASAPFFLCPMWVTDLPGALATTPVVVSADQTTLYVGVDSTLHALDAATGSILWTAPLGSPITAAPALGESLVFVPTASGSLSVLSAGGCGTATCAPSWTGSSGSALTVQPAIVGTGSNAVVLTGRSDGGVDAFGVIGCGSATCAPLWSGDAGAPVTGAPAVSNGRVYVGTETGLVAFGL